MEKILQWVAEHWEGAALTVGTPVAGAIVWALRRGTSEALTVQRMAREDHVRTRQLERAMQARETLCTDHREALGQIRDAIQAGKLETLHELRIIGERVSRLEGINRGERHRADTDSD